MRECIRRGLYGALLAGGLMVFGAGAASASDQAPTNEDGVLSGNGLGVSVEIPVNVDGNAVSVIGDSTSTGTATNGEATGGYAPESAPANTEVVYGSDQQLLGAGGGIVTDNTTEATVTAPVNVGGNAVSGVGDSTAGPVTNSSAVGGYAPESAPANTEVVYGSDQQLLGAGGGIVTDNTTDATVTAPVNVGGNAVSVIGDSTTGTATNGDHKADGHASGAEADQEGAKAAAADNNGLHGTGDGIITDNTTNATVTAPVNVDGNAISIIGDSNTGTATNGDHETDGDANEGDTTKEDEADEADHEGTDASFGDGLLGIGDGIVSGNNTDATVTAPVNVDGNAISIVGDSTTGTATNGDHKADGHASGADADQEGANAAAADNDGLLGTDGIITDNNTDATVTAPVNVDGNAISIVGDSTTGTATNGDHETDGEANGADAKEGEADEADHEGTDASFGDGLLGIGDGIVSGNNTDATVTAPVNVDGNAISIIGDSTTGTATNGDHETDGDANEADGAKEGEADESDHEGTDASFGDGLLGIGDGVLSDNDTSIDADLPVNIDGNSISIIGDSNTGTATNGDHETEEDANEGDATKEDEADHDHEGTDVSFGDGLLGIGDGIITDNNTDAAITAPVNVDGNAVSIIGDSTATGTATNGNNEAEGDANEGDAAKEDEADGDHEGTEGESKESGAITGSGDAVNEDSDDAIDNGNAGQGGASDESGNADVDNQEDLVGATGNEDEVIDSGSAGQGAVNVEVDGIVASAGFSGGAGTDGSSDVRDSASVGTAFSSSDSAGSEFELFNLSSAAEPAPLADTGADVAWALMMGALLLLTGVASFRVRRVLIMSEVD
ncbi:chaplin family protein [Arthrobacter monumenti]